MERPPPYEHLEIAPAHKTIADAIHNGQPEGLAFVRNPPYDFKIKPWGIIDPKAFAALYGHPKLIAAMGELLNWRVELTTILGPSFHSISGTNATLLFFHEDPSVLSQFYLQSGGRGASITYEREDGPRDNVGFPQNLGILSEGPNATTLNPEAKARAINILYDLAKQVKTPSDPAAYALSNLLTVFIPPNQWTIWADPKEPKLLHHYTAIRSSIEDPLDVTRDEYKQAVIQWLTTFTKAYLQSQIALHSAKRAAPVTY